MPSRRALKLWFAWSLPAGAAAGLGARALWPPAPARSEAAAPNPQFVAADDAVAALRAALAELRPREAALRRKWVEDEAGWHKLPARAWPPVQPPAEQVPALRALVASRCAPGGRAGLKDAVLTTGKVDQQNPRLYKLQEERCALAEFELATALVFGNGGPAEGRALYARLARGASGGGRGDAQAMVATGLILVEGLADDAPDADEAVEARVAEGVAWLRRASALDEPQGDYELAVLLYVGYVLPDDAAGACALFRKSAGAGLAAAQFMYGDCLLEGIGCERDAAASVPFFLGAAQQGHRGARGRLKALLDADGQEASADGKFSDSSRQSPAR